MTESKFVKYLLMLLIISSAVFYYGAYVLGVLGFAILLIRQPAEAFSLLPKTKLQLASAAALLLSIAFSKDVKYSIVMGCIILVHLMTYIFVTKNVSKQNVEWIYRLLNALGVVVSIYGIYQYLSGNLIVNGSWTDQNTYGSLTRVYSTMRNPNMLAAYLSFNLCYAAAYFTKKRVDAFTAVNILLSSVCLILTYSRGGFVAFAAGMAVIFVLGRDKRIITYLIFMLLLYFGCNHFQSFNRASLSTLSTDSSSLYRVEIWKASWNLFMNNFAFGSGPGSVMRLLSYSSDKLRGVIVHAHNMPLQVLTETGIAGFTAFVLLIYSMYKKSVLSMLNNNASECSYVAMGFTAALTAALVHGMVDCAVLVPSRSLIFLIYLALFPAVYAKEEDLFQVDGVGNLPEGKCPGYNQGGSINQNACSQGCD